MTAISQKVEMVFGARDSGAAKALDAIRSASDRAEKSASKLGTALIGFGAGFLTAGFAKKVISYAVDVAKAADKTSELGIAAQEFGKSFESFTSRFRDGFGKAVAAVLPLLTKGFDLLSLAIDKVVSAMEKLGLVSRDELEFTAQALERLKAGDLRVIPSDRQMLLQAGAQTRPVYGDNGGFAGEEITNRADVIDRLAGRYAKLREEADAIAAATAEAAENERKMASAAASREAGRALDKQMEKDALAGYQQARDGSFLLGAQEAVDKLRGSIMNLGDYGAAAVGMLNDGLMGTADLLVESFRGTTDLGEGLKQLGSDLLAQFAKMLVYQALLKGTTALLGGIGFAHGGVMRGGGRGSDEPLRLAAYANGGIARGPQLALYGETSRPEAYVPLPDGRSIPVTMQAAGGDTFIMNVNAIDARSFEQRLAQHPRVYTTAMRRGLSSNGGDRSVAKRAVR